MFVKSINGNKIKLDVVKITQLATTHVRGAAIGRITAADNALDLV